MGTLKTVPAAGLLAVAGLVFGDSRAHAEMVSAGYGLTVSLAFSELALATLSRRGEAVIVDASYWGTPTPAGAAQADEAGQINLGGDAVEVPAIEGVVEITGRGVLTDMLEWTVAGSIGVNVNVYSARLSSDDNLLSCDFIDGPLADVQTLAMPITLNCGLIEENLDTVALP
ncbi:hypothetical protein [Pararhodobacter zhoushanensis]|uniref:hypothetical protein n=1 Tax=Pararhodobacter zhoushanensis TaxID=2479545 RepID=UPI000F8C7836|nr:hypothetical protein [Pararhodobacter zhoushanensis]